MSGRRPTSYDRDVVVKEVCALLGLDPKVTNRITITSAYLEVVTHAKRKPITTERFEFTRRTPARPALEEPEPAGDDE